MCVLDAGRANQSIQQLSSTLQRGAREEDEEEGRGLRPSLLTPMDQDKPTWSQKTQSEAGRSAETRTHVK